MKNTEETELRLVSTLYNNIPKKVLIIEDNPVNLKLTTDILVAHGYEILQATSGGEAYKVLECRHKEISLILLDLKLPDMDGIEIIKKLKSSVDTENIPVIVVSAHAMESDIKATKQAGCTDYITKPINVREFLNKITLLLYR